MIIDLGNAIQQVEEEYEGVTIIADVLSISREELVLSVTIAICGGTLSYTFYREYVPAKGDASWKIDTVVRDIKRYL